MKPTKYKIETIFLKRNLAKAKRKAAYTEALKRLAENVSADPSCRFYLCIELSFLSDHDYTCLEEGWPEFSLFKEIDHSGAWIKKQICAYDRNICYLSDIEKCAKVNEYRIFILQLCIEMCND